MQAHNRVRAFAGWPGTWAWLQAGDAAPVKAKLLKTRPAPAEAARPDGREVVVKVQYPEVARMYEADFDNLELVTRLDRIERALSSLSEASKANTD